MADPIEQKLHGPMNKLARMVDRELNGPSDRKPEIGFVLLTARFGQIDGGRVNYISNGQRADMIAMLREYLARVEGRYSEPTEGKLQ